VACSLAVAAAFAGCESEESAPGADLMVDIGTGNPDCAGPDPAVQGTVTGSVGQSRAAFDVSYRLCDLSAAASDETCTTLSLRQSVTVDEPTITPAAVQLACIYDDDGGLTLTLPSADGSTPALHLTLPGRGEDSLVDCYDVGAATEASGAVLARFPKHEQQDVRTHDEAATGNSPAEGACSVKITGDGRSRHASVFRLTGVFVCRDLHGPSGGSVLLPPGKRFVYDLVDGSFSVDCHYP
jgi:hypothetical protein